MANTTVSGAKAIHGQNPQLKQSFEIVSMNAPIGKNIASRSQVRVSYLAIDKVLTRSPAASIIDKAIELRAIGGVYGGNQKPTEFLCLLLKLLQIQPEKEILLEYLQADEFKYLRALAALYVRMTFRAVEVYEILEPLLKDYRKLRLRNMNGYALTFFDEFVYELLTEERVCDIILPRIPKRQILEETVTMGVYGVAAEAEAEVAAGVRLEVKVEAEVGVGVRGMPQGQGVAVVLLLGRDTFPEAPHVHAPVQGRPIALAAVVSRQIEWKRRIALLQ
ncbi:hypothetical protein NP233_g9668 [Leucocoprinus birnbaumii]|uniref:Pre-mRNA-splicing factor 38 n=1 Tax=Leucocoprinus birnbaumii TaxID=56174 RepID=A0AAD5VK00_9AGAR|nr:hypothetical protein NP233_g9668 [Leucocoprinus birnbaumii]